MQRACLSIAVVTGVFISMLSATTASAQATRTWVSGVGDDANPCSRTAPCKTYAGAISKTATNGEINCIDPGGYGSLTITKSISVICDYTEGGITSSGATAFIINAPTDSVVSLVGHDVECAGTGIDGIRLIGVGVLLHINKVKIRNCRAANGVNIANTSGVANVMISDSNVTDSGAAISNAGVLIRPTGGASANVAIVGTKLEANINGIFFDGSGGAGGSNLAVKDSVLTTSSANGIAVASTGGTFKATVTNSLISLNAGVGAAVAGASATLQLGDNTIAGNTTGVSNAGGTLLSFKNNQIGANGTDGTPITAFPGPGGQALQ